MSVTRIATRYAKSLIELAIDQKKLEQVNNDVQTLHAAARHRELYLMLKSPIVNSDKKIAALSALFSGKIDDLTMAYLRLLVEKGREGYIPEIANEFAVQYKTLKKITTVKVVSATPLSENVIDVLKKKLLSAGLTHENLEVETAVDPELIGGFVLEFGGRRYDASVADKLADLKVQFSKNLYIKEY